MASHGGLDTARVHPRRMSVPASTLTPSPARDPSAPTTNSLDTQPVAASPPPRDARHIALHTEDTPTGAQPCVAHAWSGRGTGYVGRGAWLDGGDLSPSKHRRDQGQNHKPQHEPEKAVGPRRGHHALALANCRCSSNSPANSPSRPFTTHHSCNASSWLTDRRSPDFSQNDLADCHLVDSVHSPDILLGFPALYV